MADFFVQRSAAHFEQENKASSLSFLEASTLLLYRTGIDVYGNDVPMASGFALKMNTYTFTGVALMELALRGHLRMDEVKPLENYAHYNRTQSPSRPMLSLFLGLFAVCFLSICAAFLGLLATSIAIAAFLLALFALLALAALHQWPALKNVQGVLIVRGEPPVGEEFLDEVLWQMQPIGRAMTIRNWLSFLSFQQAGKQWVKGFYDQIERKLQEEGCIRLMGKERVHLFGELETLVLNRQSEQWERLSKQLRQALLSEGPPDLATTALLILLTTLPDTFQDSISIRFPGQPVGRKIIGGIRQFLLEQGEVERAGQRLRALIDGDPAVAQVIGPDLYDILLRLSFEIRRGPRRK